MVIDFEKHKRRIQQEGRRAKERSKEKPLHAKNMPSESDQLQGKVIFKIIEKNGSQKTVEVHLDLLRKIAAGEMDITQELHEPLRVILKSWINQIEKS